MKMHSSLPAADKKLVQIVDAALADAARRSGEWLVCRKGCTQCCIGPFPISQLDAARLREGLADLDKNDPKRARRVRQRAKDAVKQLSPTFPGDPTTGTLGTDEGSQSRFAGFADDEPCPALDPTTGTCDLYSARPMTCRTFGPPVRTGENGALGVCDLCYHGATDEQIAACEMVPDPDGLEEKLTAKMQKQTGRHGETIVAFALADLST
jgi:Fe-S-cluster containining protein